jgi:hypothetical protein
MCRGKQRRANERSRVASVDECVAGVDERVAGIDERVAGVNERVVAVDDTMAPSSLQESIVAHSGVRGEQHQGVRHGVKGCYHQGGPVIVVRGVRGGTALK